MYPFASLPENLAAFCDTLRRDHGFRIGPRELQDATRALEVTPLADERAVRNALRPVLSSSPDHVRIFDQVFHTFFYRGSRLAQLDAADVPSRGQDESVRLSRNRGDSAPSSDSGHAVETSSSIVGTAAAVEPLDEGDERAIGLLRTSYSPLDAESPPPDLLPPDAEWRGAARAFVQRLRTGLSRRWRPAARGQRFDLRRTLRHSLHTGGEAVVPRWRARVRRRPRFVVLVDGSRSMLAHSHPALQLAVALASVAADVEVFTFSTTLERITRDVRGAVLGERRRLTHLRHAWGGGTSIGVCLREFVRQHGARMVSRDTVVVIASDGLDVGAPTVLREGMAYLHRRAAGVVWLNPLRRSVGYEPTAVGMRAALPYVTTLASVQDAVDLQALSRTVRLR